MAKSNPPWTLGQLAELLQGELHGPADLLINGVTSAGSADAESIAFAETDEYREKAEQVPLGALLVGPGMTASVPYIVVPAPRSAFFALLSWCDRPLQTGEGVHPTAQVAASATIEPGASVGPFAVVGEDSVVEAGSVIHAHGFVGDRCRIGAGSVIYPRAVLVQDVILGTRCIIHPGAVIGAEGFGFVWDGKRRIKIPQVGGVTLGDDVEIGANACVDRATAGQTRIANGVKIDNLCQIAHNCEIGEHTVIAGACGITGSVKIGARCVLGGGVGTNDHISICDDVILGGRSGVDRDITEPGAYFGTPARPIGEAMRAFVLIPKLPEIWSRLKKLEKKVGE
ncbi:MAG: UDP-3-O-(3-hydroxymyristoyl)glucosamine N-acyltransferase [Methanoregulaceae archaeon]|jgi:UDP-3-O-[3-hydroxymyristoyl] glucosamine N-acyltransferase|nr:UDP-3-O-(3-hydroxymyristoyl)glucosamine N-acyltransferase [Methanoregulaceae archaeon]